MLNASLWLKCYMCELCVGYLMLCCRQHRNSLLLRDLPLSRGGGVWQHRMVLLVRVILASYQNVMVYFCR